MAITRLNVDGKPLAFKEEVTVHTENANIHVTSDEHSGLQDLLNPYAPINRSGMINVGQKINSNKIVRFGLAQNGDWRTTMQPPYVPTYWICEGNVSEFTEHKIISIGYNPVTQSTDDFITAFNLKNPNIIASYAGDLKCGKDGGNRAIIEIKLINEYADRDDIFIIDVANTTTAFAGAGKPDGIIPRLLSGGSYKRFKDHTSLDITLNGESVWGHITNTDIHTTTAEKAEWNNKQDALQHYTESTNSVVIGDTDTNATVTLKCGNTEVVLDEAALIKLNQLLSATFAYPPENS